MHEPNSLNNSLRAPRVWVNVKIPIHRSDSVNVSWSPERGRALCEALVQMSSHYVRLPRRTPLFLWRNWCWEDSQREQDYSPSRWSSAAFHHTPRRASMGDNRDVCQQAAKTASNAWLSDSRSKDALSSFSPATTWFCGPCSLPKSIQKTSAVWGWGGSASVISTDFLNSLT